MVQSELETQSSDWVLLYRIGSIGAIAYILSITLTTTMFIVSDYDTELSGVAHLVYISEHRTWWMLLQGLVLGTNALLIPTFMALYPALVNLDRSNTAIGVVLGISCMILFIAYFPPVNGLVYLSDEYVNAVTPEARSALAGGAEALVAQMNVYGPSDTLLGVAVLFISIVMLKGVFHKTIAYLGIATFVVSVVGAMLKPVLGVAYLWWWLLFILWLAAVAWKLWQFGWQTRRLKNTSIKGAP